MKIAVAHHSLNIPGGAERLCLTAIEALRKRGHNITLVTVEKTDWANVHRNFGKTIKPNEEVYATKARVSKNLSTIPIASTYFLVYVMEFLASKSKGRYDLIVNTFGDVVNSIADITYVHFPLRAALEYSQVPAFTNKLMWHAVAPVYDATISVLDRFFPGKLLTNSKFMQEVIKKVLRRESLVVYPPVDVGAFSSRQSHKSGCLVATISSYTPKRCLEQVPAIAKHSRSAKFVVIGKTDEYSLPVLKRINSQVKTLHVEDKVKLLTNVPFSEVLKTLLEARVYLHVMPFDHFGISVVESMASGCVPVVHRSGGPWLDILDSQQGKYGFSYTSPEEAADFIDALVDGEKFRSEVASRAFHRAKRFDKSVFMEKIVEVVETTAN